MTPGEHAPASQTEGSAPEPDHIGHAGPLKPRTCCVHGPKCVLPRKVMSYPVTRARPAEASPGRRGRAGSGPGGEARPELRDMSGAAPEAEAEAE